MQLQMHTDYAIRVLLYLSVSEDMAPIHIMSEELGIKETYLPKILKPLRKAGWITSSTGSAGGYRLVRPAEQITLLDIYQLMEDSICWNRCLEEDGFCSRNATAHCTVHRVYRIFQGYLESFFSAVTIADLADANHIQDLEQRMAEHLERKSKVN